MKHRIWSLMASMALLAGCAPGNPGLVVLNVVAPNEQCLFDIANAEVPHGVFDTSLPGNSYEATIRYGNQLINLGNNGTTGLPMADPNIIDVQEVEIELLASNGEPLAVAPNPFTVFTGGGVIASSDGSAPGEGLGTVTLIPAVYGDMLAGQVGDILVSVRAVGTTLGGAEVVSNEFVFPITLVNGGLLQCQMDDEGAPVCAPACRPGQDEVDVRPAHCGSAVACSIGG